MNIQIDKLTNSIENTVSGDCFQTEVILVSKEDIRAIAKKEGWLFDWKQELKQAEREVYKLTIAGNPKVIQGLICIETKQDHIFMHLVESAPFNKGKNKLYTGVPGNLVAFACRLSLLRGHEGNIAFISKTKLINHYIFTLGAIHIGAGVMIIDRVAALKLIHKYYKNQ